MNNDQLFISETIRDLIKGIYEDPSDINSTCHFAPQPFYGAVINGLKRKIDRRINAAMELDFDKLDISIKFNPDRMRLYSRITLVGVLIETCMHLVNRHMIRYRRFIGPIINTPLEYLDEEQRQELFQSKEIADYAMDIAVNQFIRPYDTPQMADGSHIIIPNYRMVLHAHENETWESYYEKIKSDPNAIEKLSKSSKMDSHQSFDNAPLNEEDVSDKMLDEKIKRMVRRAANSVGIGRLPQEVKAILDEFLKEESVPWHSYLRNWAKTSTQYDRDLHIMRESSSIVGVFPGKKNIPKPEFHIYRDESGSVSDEQTAIFHAHTCDIMEQLKASVWIHHFDTIIHHSQPLRRKNDAPVRHAGGGTNFDCIVEHARANRHKNIIILTDGFAPMADMTGINAFFVYTRDHQKHPAKRSIVLS